jgi:hypothetical protein
MTCGGAIFPQEPIVDLEPLLWTAKSRRALAAAAYL